MVKARKIFLALTLVVLLLPAVPVDAALKKGCDECPALKVKNADGTEKVLLPGESKSIFLPACVYYEGDRSKGGEEKDPPPFGQGRKAGDPMTREECCGCRDVNTFLDLAVKIMDWIFSIVGAVALVVFIYGGFMMLTSAGSDEKVKKGRDALVAAVIGLVIMFSAHLIIRFVLEGALGETSPKLDPSGGLKVDIAK